MLTLLWSTLGMMGLTFVIGFFVAGVIKIIANWADLWDFYNLHRDDILKVKRMHKLVHQTVTAGTPSIRKKKSQHDRFKRLAHKINETMNNAKSRSSIPA